MKEIYHLKSDKKLAEFLDVKASTISAWRSRNSLNYDLLLNKCDNVDLNWLFFSTKKENDQFDRLNQGFTKLNNNESETFYPIPPLHSYYNDTKLEDERLSQSPDDYNVILTTDFIKNTLKSEPGDLYYYYNLGDSMLPLLRDKDYLIVNVTMRQPHDGGVFVIKVGNLYSCRRLQILPGDRMQITCDNNAYSYFIVDKEVDDFKIVGRVLWYSRKL